MANIRDIAKMANVSVTTVSRVLNNHPYVSEEKREAVLQVIKEQNYQQNIHAVHLSRGKSNLVGVVVPFAKHPYFGLLLEGIANEAIEHDYHLVLIQTNYDEKKEQEALEMLKYKQIDALIICSRISAWKVVEEYASFGDIIVCENASDRKKVQSVYVDHYEGFYQALQYLYEKGHQRIGYCIGRQSGSNSYFRAKAYQDFLHEKQLPFDESFVFYENYYLEDGQKVVNQLSYLDLPPTSLLVTSDVVAAGILTACQDKGIHVPENLAIVGFDNQPIAKMMKITTFEIPIVEMGRKLFSQVKKESPIKHKELDITLVERETV
ncbi:LacI family DNA-binding transcriptional regulator [Gracilibacillus sp. YIM 98692]|uniref:LacI family DNA-binding transcriptional regulator n=1 Tax=Gracilibacillus sp. YIM 98692 TaxID=2663532 RepID=UPI0013D590EC|nr:LacI family DNA-binding transcriptional regulator [Gracilibacillus sp. YIM 98692]